MIFSPQELKKIDILFWNFHQWNIASMFGTKAILQFRNLRNVPTGLLSKYGPAWRFLFKFSSSLNFDVVSKTTLTFPDFGEWILDGGADIRLCLILLILLILILMIIFHSYFDFYLIRRDLVLETFRDKFSYVNHFIITSKYKFSYWWKELITAITWV